MPTQAADLYYFGGLPEDPELAFLHLEEIFRGECDSISREYNPQEFPLEPSLAYVANVLAAREELELEILNWRVPSAEDFSRDTFANFRRDVDQVRTKFQIRNTRRHDKYSVRFDAKTKTKVHHFIAQIREVFQALEVDQPKKEALLSKLNDLAGEVDRDRTRLSAWAEFTIGVAGIAGDAIEKLEPARKWIDSIARLIHGVQEDEQARLPAPQERKRIEGPPRSQPKKKEPDFSRELDDEVPF